jgi:hypothetical protein
MFTVEELIGDLLLRHNCVVVPSFGGFVAKKMSATIDYKNGVMYPPKKSVMFNRQLVNNDGLLITEFALLNKVDYAAAQEVVLAKVQEWNEQLNNGVRITLDKVGYIFFDQEKNLCFEQDRFFNLLMESYGLGKVHFLSEEDIELSNSIKAKKEFEEIQKAKEEPVKEESFKLVALPTEVETEKSNEPIEIALPKKNSRSKLWRYAAAVILAPIAFYSFWIPMNSNVLESGIISFKDFNLSYKSTDGIYIPSEENIQPLTFKSDVTLEESVASLPNDVYVYAYPFDDETYIAVKLKDGQPVNDIEIVPELLISENEEMVELPVDKPVHVEAPKPEIKKEQKQESAAKFNFVVGSFSTRENAQLLVDEINAKGFKALVLPNGKSYRVSAGKTNSESEIKSIANKAKANGYNGWVLR